ncbi:MAG TPA: AmmeMemoRadiSam system protein B [Deltaproteobacteria bacterium]|nr:AmmeMemoRadiSam system protein B [Deltaproteobacteria bacterium]
MIRKPAVAGQFYPDNPATLEEVVKAYMRDGTEESFTALIVPHAGYIYSGSTAGRVFARARIPDSVVLIGPNHTGLGKKVSVMGEGSWEIPLGIIDVDKELAGRLLAYPLFSSDKEAHIYEHSLEVELPFIYTKNPHASIVPITVMPLGYRECVELGIAIADVIRQSRKEVLIVVSSDMNHYESDDVTRQKDMMAIERILSLDPEGLYTITRRKNITMCGVVPATIALVAAKELGATEATLIEHTTSAQTSGDYDHVVGYAGIGIK